jgi:hypothetical protein
LQEDFTEDDEPDADDAMGSDGAALAQEHGPAAEKDPEGMTISNALKSPLGKGAGVLAALSKVGLRS